MSRGKMAGRLKAIGRCHVPGHGDGCELTHEIREKPLGRARETRDWKAERIQIVTRESGAWVKANYPDWLIVDSDDGLTVEGGTSYLLEAKE